MNSARPAASALGESFLNRHPNAVLVIDGTGQVIHANRAAAWLAMNGAFHDFSQMTGLTLPSSASADGLSDAGWNRRLRVHSADGSSRSVEATLFPTDSARGESGLYYLELRDMTAPVDVAAACQDSLSRTEISSESAPVLTWMAGPDDVRDWFNSPWLKFRGRTLEEECADGWTDGIHPDDRERRRAICTFSVEHHDAFTMDYRLKRHDGAYRWMLDTAIPRFADGGRFLGYIGSCVDITERRNLEDKLAEHTRNLRLSDRRREDFLAKLSHELRNPLAPIANAAAVLQSMEQANPALVVIREVIGRQVEQLRRIVTDLVDVTRITRGKVVLHRSIVDIDTLIDSAIELVRPDFERRRQTVQRSGAATTVVCCDGDLPRLAQALAALLDNAGKFSAHESAIQISVELANDTIAIAVQDSGRGIAAKLLPHVFDLFTQGEQSLAREDGGLGVGLTIAKRIAELHGGAVDVASEGPGAGTVSTLQLPLRKVDAPTSTVANELNAVTARRVLIIEDRADERETLRLRVAIGGNEVRVAANAAEALQIVESFAPELVICDIGLPDVNGYELIGTLRDKFADASVRCVALTGYSRTEDRDLALDSGFDAFQVKPLWPSTDTAGSAALKRA